MNKLLCFLFGHRYVTSGILVEQSSGKYIMRYKCTRCGKVRELK